MMTDKFTYREIPRSRIATFDVFSVGMQRHHVSALLEFDVTDTRKRLQELRRRGVNVSFNAWIIKAISSTIQMHPEAASFLFSKKKLLIFNDISISFLVEKKIGGERVPIPLVLANANTKSAQELTSEIENAKNQELTEKDVVLHTKSTVYENFYYRLPGFLRRTVWRIMLRQPFFAFRKMGNVAITSVGMMGRINGWFIHKSVHPLSFGIGSVLKKAVVVDNEVVIRDMLNMTILVDHDVTDGAQMVRFLNDLTKSIETGEPSLSASD